MKQVSEILTPDKYINGQFFGDGVVRRTVLGQTDCRHKNTILTLKKIPYSQNFIKFIPQVKKSCKNCGKYLKFEVQTPEIINLFNQKIESISLEGNGCG